MKYKISLLATSRSGHNFIKEVIESWLPGIEFVMLENVLSEHIHQYPTKGTKKLIIIRDFENFLASSLKALGINNGTWDVNIDRKIKAYRSILGEIKEPTNFKNARVVDYTAFMKNEAYRRELCEELGGTYTEEKLNYVPNEGNGSSFDGFELQGRGQEMRTWERKIEILQTEWADIYLTLLKENKDLWV